MAIPEYVNGIKDGNTVVPICDSTARSSISGILDGTTIDSFADVESALADAFPRSEQAVLGAKNILKYPYTQDSWTTTEGLSGTVNSDGSITLSASSLSGVTSITVHGRVGQTDRNPMILPKGTYIISKNIVSNVILDVVETVDGAKHIITSLGVSEQEKTFELSEETQVGIQIVSATGATTISGTLYMMLRLATDPDDTYVPYAMTNRELTEEFVQETHGLTAGENVTISYGYKTKVGKIVSYMLFLSITGAISANDTLFTGIEEPILNSPKILNMSVIDSDGTFYKLEYDNANKAFKAGESIANGRSLRFSFTYACK